MIYKVNYSWQLNKKLLFCILNDQVSDIFVCELVWERLFYNKQSKSKQWTSTVRTPHYWSSKFLNAPQIIAEREASVHLTRSISKKNKQGLKEFLDFQGYKINELYPRRTRRATAVNWLIFWAKESNYIISNNGNTPTLKVPPNNPAFGHPNDPLIT